MQSVGIGLATLLLVRHLLIEMCTADEGMFIIDTSSDESTLIFYQVMRDVEKMCLNLFVGDAVNVDLREMRMRNPVVLGLVLAARPFYTGSFAYIHYALYRNLGMECSSLIVVENSLNRR